MCVGHPMRALLNRLATIIREAGRIELALWVLSLLALAIVASIFLQGR
jgi:hypothetical protein